MAGRGSFQAIRPGDIEGLLSLSGADLWDLVGEERAAVFVARVDKAWVAIHRALSDGTLFGALGEPPLANAVLGDHLIYQTATAEFVYLKYPSEVTDIAHELHKLSQKAFEEMLACVVPDEDIATLNLTRVPDAIEYGWPHFENMCAFYQQAATDRLAVLFKFGC